MLPMDSCDDEDLSILTPTIDHCPCCVFKFPTNVDGSTNGVLRMCPENDSRLSHIQRTCMVMTVLLAKGSGACSGDVTKGNKDIFPPDEAFYHFR